MFTGLIEEVGSAEGIAKGPQSARLVVKAGKVLVGLRLGDSVAVNGVCLTVTSYSSDGFTADVMAETLSKTNLGRLQPGARVNLERALQVGARLGGHFVAGHIDATARVLDTRERGIARELWIEIPRGLESFLISQGSIGVDGVSLTLAELQRQSFMVSLIPHTMGETNLLERRRGDLVNLETDLLGKYVSRLLRQEDRTGITEQLLAEKGFI